MIILEYMKSHIHSPPNPLEPHTFLRGRGKNPFSFIFLEAEEPSLLLKSVQFPLPVFSSQGRKECRSTGTERERKMVLGKKTPKLISLFPSFCSRYSFMRTSTGEDKSGCEMEVGLYQKLLLMAVGEHRGPCADVGTPEPMATFDLHRFSWALPCYCFS